MFCMGIRLTFAVAFIGLVWSAAWGQSNTQTVSIPDANLRAVLEDRLGKASGAPITDVELAKLEHLGAPNAGIVNLTGLEFATGLTTLNLGEEYVTWTNSNGISDLSPLRNLTNLTVLGLAGNSISDASPLGKLTNLEVLLLDNNSISDVSPLRKLTNLTILGLSFNPVSNASSIRDLETHLTKLTMPILLGTGILNRPKLDSSLNSAVRKYEFSLSRQGSGARGQTGQDPSQQVLVKISTDTKEQADLIVRFLRDNGVSDLYKIADPNIVYGQIEAQVPVRLLVRLAEQPGVRVVLKQFVGISLTNSGPVEESSSRTPADAHGATAWHEAGYGGENIKVGVIDVGFKNFGSVAGQLMGGVKTQCYTVMNEVSSDRMSYSDCERNTDHGTNMAKELLGIAPNVSLFISNPPTSGVPLRKAVDWMIEQGVQVINHSVVYPWDGPGDGNSVFSPSPLRTVNYAVNNGGIVWVNSAGNSTRYSWFSDSGFSDGDGPDSLYLNYNVDNVVNADSSDPCNIKATG